MVATLPDLTENAMQVEFLGTIETILETLRAEGVAIEEITILDLEEN